MINVRLVTKILSWVAVGGVALTSYLSAKCSKKVPDNATTAEKAKTYAPAIVSGMATSACILTSDHLSGKAITSLAAVAAYATTNRDKIKQKLVDAVGKDEAQKMIAEANDESVPEVKGAKSKKLLAPWEGPSIEWTGYGDHLFLDGYSGRLFRSSPEMVQEALTKINEQFHDNQEVSLNDYYRALGITETGFGDRYCWWTGYESFNGYIEFVVHDTINENDEKMTIIDIFTDPFEYNSYDLQRCREEARSIVE